MNQPFKVSVIVPCYNQAKYLSDAVQSVLAQTYTNWECIIIDDGSTDNTEEVALNLVKLDGRIIYYRKENGGVSNARNFGIARAIGEYVLPLDGDDKIGEEYIKLAIEEIQNDETIKVVYCEAELFGAATGKWSLPDFDISLLAKINLIFCSALHKRKDWKEIGGYDINMKEGLEDWEYWINLLKDGGKVIKIPYTGFFYRKKSESRNNLISNEMLYKLQNYISKKHVEFINGKLGNPIYLSNELTKYKNSFEYLTNTKPYKIYKKIKNILNI